MFRFILNIFKITSLKYDFEKKKRKKGTLIIFLSLTVFLMCFSFWQFLDETLITVSLLKFKFVFIFLFDLIDI